MIDQKTGSETSDLRKKLATNVIRSRYATDSQANLQTYFDTLGSDSGSVEFILSMLEGSIEQPLEFPGYSIPDHIEENNKRVRDLMIKKIREFKSSSELDVAQLTDFTTKQHEFIKYAQNQWFIANPGVILEILALPSDTDPKLASELQEKYRVRPGDDVIHRHVISENGRKRLKDAGFAVPFEHWDRSYVVDALRSATEIVRSNPANKGIVAMGSWIYDPSNYENASDGKPYVSFDFLKDDQLVGHRIDLGPAEGGQLAFATRNDRRKQMAEKGEFKPHVYGAFYPREELLAVVPNLN